MGSGGGGWKGFEGRGTWLRWECVNAVVRSSGRKVTASRWTTSLGGKFVSHGGCAEHNRRSLARVRESPVLPPPLSDRASQLLTTGGLAQDYPTKILVLSMAVIVNSPTRARTGRTRSSCSYPTRARARPSNIVVLPMVKRLVLRVNLSKTRLGGDVRNEARSVEYHAQGSGSAPVFQNWCSSAMITSAWPYDDCLEIRRQDHPIIHGAKGCDLVLRTH